MEITKRELCKIFGVTTQTISTYLARPEFEDVRKSATKEIKYTISYEQLIDLKQLMLASHTRNKQH